MHWPSFITLDIASVPSIPTWQNIFCLCVLITLPLHLQLVCSLLYLLQSNTGFSSSCRIFSRTGWLHAPGLQWSTRVWLGVRRLWLTSKGRKKMGQCPRARVEWLWKKSKRSQKGKEWIEKRKQRGPKRILKNGKKATQEEWAVNKAKLKAEQDKNNMFKRAGPAELYWAAFSISSPWGGNRPG